MTIDDQLRDIARHAEQRQQVITAEEILHRASSQGTGSFTTRSRFNDRRKVLDHIPVQFTEEDVTMIDLETPSPTDDRRNGTKRVLVAGLLAAAVVVAIAVVATRDDDATPADHPFPTVTVPPTVPPQALPNDQGSLVPGTYYVDEVSGTPTPRIFATIGAGWWRLGDGEGWDLFKQDADADFDETTMDEHQREIGFMGFSQPAAVFLDACHSNDLSYHRGPVTTLDGLVAALSEQQGWVDVTAPTDNSIDGYAGKAFQRTAPADMSDCDTMVYGRRVGGPGTHPVFLSWVSAVDGTPVVLLNGDPDLFSGSGPYEPGQIETLWILDIDGTLVVIRTAMWPEPSAGAPADFAADVLDSIRIERA